MLPMLSNRTNYRSPFWALDRVMDDFFRTPGLSWYGEPVTTRTSVWSFPVDVMETGSEYRFVFEVPGFQLSDLDVTVENHVLRVSGERTYPYGREEEADAELRQFERRFGRFERTLTLPQGVDVDNVEAHCANGILTVTVPKVEAARPRRIEIRSGNGLGEITERASA